jgi:hypothetical protein
MLVGGVDAADAANAVRGQKFIIAQQPLENARQHPIRNQRQQMLAPVVFPVRAVADDAAVEHAVAMLAQQFTEAGDFGQNPPIHHFAGEQRNQPDPGIHVNPLALAVRPGHQILEKARFRVPQRNVLPPALTTNGVGDSQKLLINLNRDGLVIRVFGRQLQRDDGHVQRKHRHPAGGVGLLQGVARLAADASGRTPKCCPDRESRPRTRYCRRCPCG